MKSVLITGASRGIGKDIADTFNARDEFDIITLSKSGENCTYAIDLSDPVDLEKAKKIECDILINCAGILDGDAQQIFDTNVLPVMSLSETNYERMENGLIINMGSFVSEFSVTAAKTIPLQYQVSKMTIKRFSTLLADKRKKGMRVCCVEPDIVDTEMVHCYPERMRKKFINPDDVAKAVMAIVDLPQTINVTNITIRVVAQ